MTRPAERRQGVPNKVAGLTHTSWSVNTLQSPVDGTATSPVRSAAKSSQLVPPVTKRNVPGSDNGLATRKLNAMVGPTVETKRGERFRKSRLCIMFRRVLIAREGAESRRCGQSAGLHAQVFLLAGISEKMHMKIRGGVLLVRPHSPSSVTSTVYFIHSVVLSHPTWNPPSPRA